MQQTRKSWTLALTALGLFMVALDTLVVTTALPVLRVDLGAGLWGGIAGLAVAAGPVVGGGVIDGLDWHWIFWLNVPIGVALIPLGLARLTESYGPRPQLDLRGLALSAGRLLA